MADITDEELFNNALEATEPEVTQEEIEQTSTDDRPRDDQGRFAAKQEAEPKADAEPAAKVPAEQAKDEAHVPSWRLKEIREERDALRQQMLDMQRQLATQKPQAEAPKPDLFEKPDEFVAQGVRQAVDPIKAEIEGIREFFSRERAVDKYGEEKVTEAFTALDRAAKSGDPMARMTVEAVKRSMHPFGEIVQWHLKNEINTNPDAVLNRMLEEKLKDEKFKGELMAKLNPASAEPPKPVVRIPPNLSRAAAEQATVQEDGDLSNQSLFAHALR